MSSSADAIAVSEDVGISPRGRTGKVIILAGVTGRAAMVRSALGRNLFDLPAAAGQGLLATWLEWFERAFADAFPSPCEVLLAIDQAAPAPLESRLGSRLSFTVERDAESSRGSAGVIRDLTRDLDDDEHLFVLQASDLVWQATQADVRRLLQDERDVVLSADRDLRPAGLMRFRGGLLKRIPSVGFVDLKEQFLTRCALFTDVGVIRSDRPRSGSLHSLKSYITSVFSPEPEDAAVDAPANAREWREGRALVEDGAEVDPKAILFESVALAGCKVERGAVIVRSVIGPGAVVRAGEEIVDRLVVGASGRRAGIQDVLW